LSRHTGLPPIFCPLPIGSFFVGPPSGAVDGFPLPSRAARQSFLRLHSLARGPLPFSLSMDKTLPSDFPFTQVHGDGDESFFGFRRGKCFLLTPPLSPCLADFRALAASFLFLLIMFLPSPSKAGRQFFLFQPVSRMKRSLDSPALPGYLTPFFFFTVLRLVGF